MPATPPPSNTRAVDPSQRARWAAELRLPDDVVGALCHAYGPLAAWIAERRRAAGRPLVVGVNGAQGTGKSTLLSLLTRLLSEHHGLTCAGLSLDDLYLTARERQALGERVHPLLCTRGVPGTHDLALARDVLDQLVSGEPRTLALPSFDKALDERRPRSAWPRVSVPCDVAVLEGWCVGAGPEPESALQEPVNDLERRQDPDGVWRRFANTALAGPYAELFARLDALVMLAAPDLDCVRRWRIEQEHALARSLREQGRPNTTLSDEAVAAFIQHFERITRSMLREMPGRADVVVELDRRHEVVAVRRAPGGRLS